MLIIKSRKDALVDAFKNTKDSSPSDMESAWKRLAEELLKVLIPLEQGSGAPTEIPLHGVTIAPAFYHDTDTGDLYFFGANGSWRSVTLS